MSIKLSHERVLRVVERLLALAPEGKTPVPIEMMAQLKGARLRFVAHDDNLLGLLLWEDGHPVIGVNTRHDRAWQRFIIAHELAHIEMHHHSGIHIDRNFPALLKVDWLPPDVDSSEIEASMVAAGLLIPAASLATELRGQRIDYLDDTFLRALAERYQVSMQTLLFRLTL